MKILLTGASSDTGLKLTKKLIENLDNFSELTLLSSSLSISEKINVGKYNKIKIINQNLLDPFQDKLKLVLNNLAFNNPSSSHYSSNLFTSYKVISNNKSEFRKNLYM